MRIPVFIVLIFHNYLISSQSEWQNYGAIDNVQEIGIYDSIAYVGNSGGLLIIDLVTAEEALLMPANSTLEGAVTEIEFLSNGHAWLISSGNLLYFDGVEFEPYVAPDSINLRRPKQLTLFNDELWFQDFHGELYSIIDNVITDHSEIIPTDIKYFDHDSNGNIWAVNRDSLYQYDGTTILSVSEIYPDDEVFRLDGFYVDANDIKYISILTKTSSDFVLIYIDSQGRNAVKTHFVSQLFFEHDSLGVCFSSGIYGFGHIKDDTLVYTRFDSLFTELPNSSSSPARLMTWVGNNAWFKGTSLEEPLLHRYINNEVFKYGYNDAFLGEITDINSGCNEVLYKAGESKLEKFQNDQWVLIEPNYSDEECIIELLEMNPFTCELWGYGRANGNNGCNTLWKVSEDEIIEILTLDFGIIELAFSPNEEIFIIGSDRTLHCVDPSGAIRNIPIDSTILFSDIFVTSENVIWILGTDYSNPCNIKTSFFAGDGQGKWLEYPRDTTQIRTGSNCNIIEDEEGSLWFESIHGLVQYDGQDWTTHPMRFGSTGFNEMIMDESGHFWIATNEVGLAFWDRNELTYFNTENSDIFSDKCVSIEKVGNDIWVEHLYGLSRLQMSDISSTQNYAPTLSGQNITIYPNPTDGPFNIKCNGSEERKFEVYSISGQLVLSEVSSQELWSSFLKTGVYFIKVTTMQGEYIEKLIVL